MEKLLAGYKFYYCIDCFQVFSLSMYQIVYSHQKISAHLVMMFMEANISHMDISFTYVGNQGCELPLLFWCESGPIIFGVSVLTHPISCYWSLHLVNTVVSTKVKEEGFNYIRIQTFRQILYSTGMYSTIQFHFEYPGTVRTDNISSSGV